VAGPFGLKMKNHALNTDEVNDLLIDENKSEDMNNEFMRMADDEFRPC